MTRNDDKMTINDTFILLISKDIQCLPTDFQTSFIQLNRSLINSIHRYPAKLSPRRKHCVSTTVSRALSFANFLKGGYEAEAKAKSRKATVRLLNGYIVKLLP